VYWHLSMGFAEQQQEYWNLKKLLNPKTQIGQGLHTCYTTFFRIKQDEFYTINSALSTISDFIIYIQYI